MDIDKDQLHWEQQMNLFMKLFLKFNRNAEVKIARIAEAHFKENFEVGGFVDNAVEAWEPRLHDVDSGRAILVKSGDLKNSIQGAVIQPGKIVISSDLVYAKVHNEGDANRNIPQRKFIGNSKVLTQKIKTALAQEFKQTIKNKLK